MLETAQSYIDASYSIIPIRTDGSKASAIPWKPYQTSIADPATIKSWFSSEPRGIAIICGAVSGNLEDLDFDDVNVYRKWYELIESQYGRELLDRLVKIQTPRPGVAVIYRCPAEISGNQKLAKDKTGASTIETRGEGGYFLAPGCPKECHPSGRTYQLRHGDIYSPPMITKSERELLHNAARSLNEYVEPTRLHVSTPSGNGRPGDSFMASASWTSILTPHGWKLVFTQGDVQYWQRPGKDDGWSATVNYGGADLLYVFSSNAPNFDAEHSYNKFAAYTRLNHKGDYQLAAIALVKEGYGAKPPEQPDVSPIVSWTLWDAAEIKEWPVPPLVWHVDPLIPKGTIGFMGGPPKERKSLLCLDLALHLAQNNQSMWLGQFPTLPCKVLYVSREDPARRVKDRLVDICESYRMPLPESSRLQFIIREPMAITDLIHRNYLIEIIKDNGFEFVILDVLGRLTGEFEHMGKDIAVIVKALEEINFATGATILSADHTRKPQGINRGRDTQEANPFDLYGGIQKYGLAEFIFNLAKTKEGRIQIRAENKDADELFSFWVEVSGKGESERPKFNYAGSLSEAAVDMKLAGQMNKEKTRQAVNSLCDTVDLISLVTGQAISTVRKHLNELVFDRKLVKIGKGKATRYEQSAKGEDNLE